MRAVTLVGLLLWACTPPLAASLRARGETKAQDYERVLDTWTRKQDIYNGFEHKMTVSATFITPALRKAFQMRFPEIYGYGGQVTRKELVDVQKTEETVNFFVAVYTPQDKWNDLNKSDSIWHVSLSVAPEVDAPDNPSLPKLDALAIEKVKIDENLHTVYPYLTDFDQAYIVRFPAHDKTQHGLLEDRQTVLRVRIASSFGAANLDWNVLP